MNFTLKEYKKYQEKKILTKNVNGYIRINIPEHYRMYKQDPRKNDERIPSQKLYKGILETMFEKIWHEIIKEQWIFQAPANFGWFYISESMGNGFYVDWGKSKRKNERSYSYNYHTNGLTFYFKWLKVGKLIRKTLYGASAYRGVKEEYTGSQGIHAWVKKCSEDPLLPDYRGNVLNR